MSMKILFCIFAIILAIVTQSASAETRVTFHPEGNWVQLQVTSQAIPPTDRDAEALWDAMDPRTSPDREALWKKCATSEWAMVCSWKKGEPQPRCEFTFYALNSSQERTEIDVRARRARFDASGESARALYLCLGEKLSQAAQTFSTHDGVWVIQSNPNAFLIQVVSLTPTGVAPTNK